MILYTFAPPWGCPATAFRIVVVYLLRGCQLFYIMPRLTPCGTARAQSLRRFSNTTNVLEAARGIRKVPLDWVKPKAIRHKPASCRPPTLTAEDQRRIHLRRTKKAERDERMDITAGLTPVKECVTVCRQYTL